MEPGDASKSSLLEEESDYISYVGYYLSPPISNLVKSMGQSVAAELRKSLSAVPHHYQSYLEYPLTKVSNTSVISWYFANYLQKSNPLSWSKS